MTDTVFQKIIDKEIPAKLIWEDQQCIAFDDLNPQAPTHILIIPKQSIEKIDQINASDENLIGHLIYVATQIAKEQKLNDYRLVINNGAKGGQSVFHLHLHLIGGRVMTWPPG